MIPPDTSPAESQQAHRERLLRQVEVVCAVVAMISAVIAFIEW